MKTVRAIAHTLLFRISLVMFLTGLVFSCQSASKQQDDAAKKVNSPDASVAQTKPASTETQATAQGRKLVVYYFHGTFRCPSCNTIERLTKEAVESGFADQIKSGRVELKVLNVEEPGNEHFVEDYKLYTKSVILSDVKDGKEANWKNLDQVWTLLRNEGKFVDYVKKEVNSYLGG